MAEQSEAENPYAITLGQLAGTHYLPVVADGDTDLDADDTPPPGSPVAYVAEPLKQRHSGYTVEGYIEALGDFAVAVGRNPRRRRRVGRVLTFLIVTALLSGYLTQLARLFR